MIKNKKLTKLTKDLKKENKNKNVFHQLNSKESDLLVYLKIIILFFKIINYTYLI